MPLAGDHSVAVDASRTLSSSSSCRACGLRGHVPGGRSLVVPAGLHCTLLISMKRRLGWPTRCVPSTEFAATRSCSRFGGRGGYTIVGIPGEGQSVGDVRGSRQPTGVGQDSTAASPAPGPRRVQDECNWNTRARATAAREKGIGRQALGGRSVRLVGRLAQDWVGDH